MRRIKLTRMEQAISDSIDEYVTVPKAEYDAIAKALEARRKNAVLNIRVNQGDLNNIKNKAKRLGIKYQTFISEILHNVAMAK